LEQYIQSGKALIEEYAVLLTFAAIAVTVAAINIRRAKGKESLQETPQAPSPRGEVKAMTNDKQSGPSFDAVFGTTVKVIFSIILVLVLLAACQFVACVACVSNIPDMPERYDVTE